MIQTCDPSGKPEVASCKLCRFWMYLEVYQKQDGKSFGACKRHSPTSGKWGNTEWPVTSEVDWCGEFEHEYFGL